MGQTRQGLAVVVNEILVRHGTNGRRMSFRQAERITGLSPATVGELAKGNARTPETVRRFAIGMGEDLERLFLMAGFVPEEADRQAAKAVVPSLPSTMAAAVETRGETEPDEREWLGRFGRALAKMPPGRERDLWKDGLRRDTELLESFLQRLSSEAGVAEDGENGS